MIKDNNWYDEMWNPTQNPIKATRILEISYRYGEKGNRIVSCVLQDDSCPNCVIKARGHYVKENL